MNRVARTKIYTLLSLFLWLMKGTGPGWADERCSWLNGATSLVKNNIYIYIRVYIVSLSRRRREKASLCVCRRRRDQSWIPFRSMPSSQPLCKRGWLERNSWTIEFLPFVNWQVATWRLMDPLRAIHRIHRARISARCPEVVAAA